MEIVGPSGAGKSTLCAFLLMTTLLPRSFQLVTTHGGEAVSVPLGGRGGHAYLLSPASHPPLVPRIESALRAHIETRIAHTLAENGQRGDLRSPLISAAIDEQIAASLARLYVLQPRPRAIGWTLALQRVRRPSDDLGAPDLVVCDGFADGFWPERWEDEKGDRRRGPGGSRVRGLPDAGMKDVWDAVTALRRDTGAVVVLTAQGVRVGSMNCSPTDPLSRYPTRPSSSPNSRPRTRRRLCPAGQTQTRQRRGRSISSSRSSARQGRCSILPKRRSWMLCVLATTPHFRYSMPWSASLEARALRGLWRGPSGRLASRATGWFPSLVRRGSSTICGERQ